MQMARRLNGESRASNYNYFPPLVQFPTVQYISTGMLFLTRRHCNFKLQCKSCIRNVRMKLLPKAFEVEIAEKLQEGYCNTKIWRWNFGNYSASNIFSKWKKFDNWFLTTEFEYELSMSTLRVDLCKLPHFCWVRCDG